MTTVFISGSMKIKIIHPLVYDRIENIIRSSLDIIVGDADGVDSSIQSFLKDKSYEKVVVYCTGKHARNNVGMWEVKKITSEEKENTRKFYTAKDIEMAHKCDFGLMVWDSKSTGTLANVARLLKQGKKSMVFVNKINSFHKVSHIRDFEALVSLMSESAHKKADKKISIEKLITELKQGNLFEARSMKDKEYKKFTIQAKAGIKGEAFFEALVSDYSLPHHIVGSKDLGIDYICEWVFENKPTGILYAVQVKTRSQKSVELENLGPNSRLNELCKYRIKGGNLKINELTLRYWQGLGMPVYLFLIVHSEFNDQGGRLDCYYKRFTPILTSTIKQEDEDFYKVNDGTTFLAFADRKSKRHGFARDLFIDLMRCSYSRGSISYISPRVIGLQQFPEEDIVFGDLFKEYRENICRTYAKTRGFLERVCVDHRASSDLAIPNAGPPDDDADR